MTSQLTTHIEEEKKCEKNPRYVLKFDSKNWQFCLDLLVPNFQ
jgi:hypothetical protein